MSLAKIYRPSKSAMQSGIPNSRKWILEYVSTGQRKTDPLMGWTSVNSTLGQVKLSFDTLEDAQAYAKKKGLVVSVSHVNETLFRPKSYTDNFTKKIR